MTGSETLRRRWPVLAAIVLVLTAGGVVVVRMWPDPTPERAPFVAYRLVKTGGVAGVRDTVEVAADGTVLFADADPVAGRLTRARMDRLGVLLHDRRLPKEGGRGLFPKHCADTFTYTLTVGGTKASYDECDGGAPVLREIVDLTGKDGLRPLPASAPAFRGLTATYRKLSPSERATVRIAPDGTATVRRDDDPVERERLDTGTVDALRLLYAKPLTAPKGRGGVSCAPEQVPTYVVTPKGAEPVKVSLCGGTDDYRWTARLTILTALLTT